MNKDKFGIIKLQLLMSGLGEGNSTLKGDTRDQESSRSCSIEPKRKYTEGGSRDLYTGRNTYKLTVWGCRGGIRKAKACLELNQARDGNSNKKGF